MSENWKIAGICFEHMHMGDLLKCVHEHPRADIAGISHSEIAEMKWSIDQFGLSKEKIFLNFEKCLRETRPDILILCPGVARHLEWVKKVAVHPAHIILEKPFALNLSQARAIKTIMEQSGKHLLINWPMAWYPTNITCHRLIEEGHIGKPLGVHYYDGNRGPLFHGPQKEKREAGLQKKQSSWWYQKDEGGGSLMDYLGYGVTLGTWFLQGKKPTEVMASKAGHPDLEVDEQSITVLKYPGGLSKFETRWGTFTDPWIHQPAPKCGFVISGTGGSLSSYDFEDHVTLYNKESPGGLKIPADIPGSPNSNPVEYLIHCLENDQQITGPLSVETSLTGQEIVDAALLSSETGNRVRLDRA